ncbi:hypothetical protein [Streptomyces boninensis]
MYEFYLADAARAAGATVGRLFMLAVLILVVIFVIRRISNRRK